MSGGKKRSGFQITSVTSDLNQPPGSQSAPSVVVTVVQSEASSCRRQGSSSQPTTPSLKRKYTHDALGQGAGSLSRFRVVRLAVGGAGGGGRGQPYRRGRWTCTEFVERQEGAGFRRVMGSLRHAHSLESLEMIGRDRDRGGARSQDATHLLAQPIKHRQGAEPALRSGPPSPTLREPIRIQLLDTMPPLHRPAHETPRPLYGWTSTPQDGLSSDCVTLSPAPPTTGLYHPTPTPVQTPGSFSLDQTIFNLPGDDSSSSNSLIAIDNKIEQAMDLVKSHLMLAVREEVELLKEQIRELQEKNQQLEKENHILRTLTYNRHTT